MTTGNEESALARERVTTMKTTTKKTKTQTTPDLAPTPAGDAKPTAPADDDPSPAAKPRHEKTKIEPEVPAGTTTQSPNSQSNPATAKPKKVEPARAAAVLAGLAAAKQKAEKKAEEKKKADAKHAREVAAAKAKRAARAALRAIDDREDREAANLYDDGGSFDFFSLGTRDRMGARPPHSTKAGGGYRIALDSGDW